MKIHTDMAGLISFEWGPWCLHMFPKRRFWTWGYVDGWYDGPLPEWGLGPLFLFVGCWPDAWCKKHKAYLPECCKPTPSPREEVK